MPPPSPEDTATDAELRRVLLQALGLLDTGPEAAFDGLTLAAVQATGCEAATLVLHDPAQRLWVKSRHGSAAALARLEAPLPDAPAPAVPDCVPDCRVCEPVRVEGRALGEFCVGCACPRPPLSAPARAALRGLADAAEALLAARRPGAEAFERALQHRQALLSRASHEMRTPLNAVLGFAQLLQLDPALVGSQAARAQAAQIERSARELLVLIERMLELARLDGG